MVDEEHISGFTQPAFSLWSPEEVLTTKLLTTYIRREDFSRILLDLQTLWQGFKSCCWDPLPCPPSSDKSISTICLNSTLWSCSGLQSMDALLRKRLKTYQQNLIANFHSPNRPLHTLKLICCWNKVWSLKQTSWNTKMDTNLNMTTFTIWASENKPQYHVWEQDTAVKQKQNKTLQKQPTNQLTKQKQL